MTSRPLQALHVRRRVPDRVDAAIVGAQKAGTSALLRYLGAHPRVRPQLKREMTWFVDPRLHRRPFSTYGERYFGPEPRDDRVLLGKLAGLMYEPNAPDRLYELNPEARVIVILREPVARAHSAYWHSRARGREPLESFEEALDGDPDRFGDEKSRRICQYVERSRYVDHLPALFDRFGRAQVSVLFLEEFLADPRHVVRGVLDPFGLDAEALPAALERENVARVARSPTLARARWGAAGRVARRLLPVEARARLRARLESFNEVPQAPPRLDDETLRRLRSRFADANCELAARLGRDLPESWG